MCLLCSVGQAAATAAAQAMRIGWHPQHTLGLLGLDGSLPADIRFEALKGEGYHSRGERLGQISGRAEWGGGRQGADGVGAEQGRGR
jgi:hypothetical protein